ncbi:DUF4190 domain-containing protein [Streptomyces sp. S.PB5]|uniref:DUF4190 domain-containing protein n=1 Tax=Streptomyces sp. S.PB5 TaxID=3020844 RepID=UPI0025B24821|nr:DUF4190 domain-containing protein [Streptomyces sp. S.PB5]MDN3026515.1 DUF4190 domain-containing protein [Streptomyces sp. S.PB5]
MSIPPPPGPHQPQGPYPPGPYTPPGPWGYGWGGYAQPVPVNGVAIAALVLGVLCFLPAVGLVLGLIALSQIKRKGERGRGMAIAGSILSSVGLALWTLSLTTGAAGEFWAGFKDAASGQGTAYALAEGDCFDSGTGALTGEAYDVDEVPCSQEHHGEVFAVEKLPAGSFPGDDALTDTAEDKCYTLRETYAMDVWAVPEDVDIYYLVPSEESWDYGDREITCVFGNVDEKNSLTGSLRNDATTLDADQIAFLKAANAVDTVLYEEPVDYAEDDLRANREWAGDVGTAFGEQAEALRGHSWPAGAEKPVADFLKGMEAAGKEWTKAAEAKDVDTYYEHYDLAYEFVDGASTVTAREALGLATTVPTYDEEDGGGSGGGGEGELDV